MAKTIKIQKSTQSVFFENALAKNKKLINTFEKLSVEHEGDWQLIKQKLTPELGFTKKQVDNLQFTHELASWNNDDPKLVNLFQKNEKTSSLRDIAFKYDPRAIKN